LFAGLTLGPRLRIVLHDGLFGGRALVETGFNASIGVVTPYVAQYDSLISGLGSSMLTAHARAGYSWALASGADLGVAYEVATIGGLSRRPTLTHTTQLALRFSSYVLD
jgi:hypothetical protein